MAVNSSPPSNASLPPPLLSSFSSYFHLQGCLNSTVNIFISTTFTITSILILLPLYIFVLYLGLQRRHRQRSGQTMSHSDIFTFHMIVIELTSVFGSTLFCCGVHTDVPEVTMAGMYFSSINSFGQMLFHVLTCVERYLAVVHPITYLSLKKTNGIRLRNVTIGCVWLLSFAGTGLMLVEDQVLSSIVCYCFLVFLLTVISFCSLSVLCVLICPGPGEVGGGRQQVGQSKLKAFYTIMAILGVLLLRFGGNMVITALYMSPQVGMSAQCGLILSVAWFGLPSSLVLPLLFLQRAGKRLCCKKDNKSGQRPD